MKSETYCFGCGKEVCRCMESLPANKRVCHSCKVKFKEEKRKAHIERDAIRSTKPTLHGML